MLYCKGKQQFTSFLLVLISVVEFFNGATSQFIQLQFRSDNWIKREWCALHQSSQPAMNYPTINKLHLHVLWLQPVSHIIPLCRYSYSDHTGTKIKNCLIMQLEKTRYTKLKSYFLFVTRTTEKSSHMLKELKWVDYKLWETDITLLNLSKSLCW